MPAPNNKRKSHTKNASKNKCRCDFDALSLKSKDHKIRLHRTKVAKDCYPKLHRSCAALMCTGTFESNVVSIVKWFSMIQVTSEIISVSTRPKCADCISYHFQAKNIFNNCRKYLVILPEIQFPCLCELDWNRILLPSYLLYTTCYSILPTMYWKWRRKCVCSQHLAIRWGT